jgi:hypothetical protein
VGVVMTGSSLCIFGLHAKIVLVCQQYRLLVTGANGDTVAEEPNAYDIR